MEVILDQITDQKIDIIKQSTCPSLSGRSELSYTIGSTPNKEQLIRIDKNSGNGKLNSEWVPMNAIQKLIKKPFHSSALKPLYEKKSANSAGFLCAAILHLGLISSCDQGYESIKTPRKKRSPK